MAITIDSDAHVIESDRTWAPLPLRRLHRQLRPWAQGAQPVVA